MKSIDELRKTADERTTIVCAESKSETVWITKEPFMKMLDAIEHEVEERYIELPKDANGEPIRVGDALQGKKHGGGWCEPFNVIRMDIDKNGWEVYELGGYSHAPSLCLHKPPTVEDLLEEALNKAASLDRKEGYWPSAADITNIVNEVASKLRLRED